MAAHTPGDRDTNETGCKAKEKMTAQQYKKARRARGTKQEIARMTGVHTTTIDRRESGAATVSREAELVLMGIPVLLRPVKDRKRGRPSSTPLLTGDVACNRKDP